MNILEINLIIVCFVLFSFWWKACAHNLREWSKNMSWPLYGCPMSYGIRFIRSLLYGPSIEIRVHLPLGIQCLDFHFSIQRWCAETSLWRDSLSHNQPFKLAFLVWWWLLHRVFLYQKLYFSIHHHGNWRGWWCWPTKFEDHKRCGCNF